MKRASAAAAVFVVVLLSGPPAYGQTPEAPSRRLRVGITGWENNLTPFSVTPAGVDLLNLVYDTLFWHQATPSPARPDPEPWLAESADPSPDRKSWTVKLRSNVKWHDGRPFTAEDVKFTFEYFKQHGAQSGRYGHHVTDLPVFRRAQVLKDTEVRLFFDQAAPSFKILPGADLPMLPRHIWQSVDEPLRALEDKPMGTGPYEVVEMTSPRRYLLAANKDYFNSKSLVEELELSVVPDPVAAFNDLAAGKLDFVSRTVPPVFVDRLAANPELTIVDNATKMESVQLNFNARKQPLSDPKLRKAISLSIDNRVLVKTVLADRGQPGVDSFIHPASAWALSGSRHEFDAAKANQLLDAAGYSRKDPDGIRRGPDGKRLEFTALFSTLEPQSLEALELISQMTTAIGVRLEPEPARPRRLRAVRRPPEGRIPAYDAYVSQLEVHTHSDPDALYFLYHSPGRGMGAQITGYSNPEFDRWVEEAATSLRVSERKRKLGEAQRIFSEEVPSLALFYPDGVYAFRPGAYSRWTADAGQGIFTKRSFLEDYAGTAASETQTSPAAPAWVFLAGVSGLVVLGSALVLLNRRFERSRRKQLELDEEPALTGEAAARAEAQDGPPADDGAPVSAAMGDDLSSSEDPVRDSTQQEALPDSVEQTGVLDGSPPGLGVLHDEPAAPETASWSSEPADPAPPPSPPRWPPAKGIAPSRDPAGPPYSPSPDLPQDPLPPGASPPPPFGPAHVPPVLSSQGSPEATPLPDPGEETPAAPAAEPTPFSPADGTSGPASTDAEEERPAETVRRPSDESILPETSEESGSLHSDSEKAAPYMEKATFDDENRGPRTDV